MNPPMVYEETKPRSQRTSKTTAMVSSILLSFCHNVADRKSSGPHCRPTTAIRFPNTDLSLTRLPYRHPGPRRAGGAAFPGSHRRATMALRSIYGVRVTPRSLRGEDELSWPLRQWHGGWAPPGRSNRTPEVPPRKLAKGIPSVNSKPLTVHDGTRTASSRAGLFSLLFQAGSTPTRHDAGAYNVRGCAVEPVNEPPDFQQVSRRVYGAQP
jgi:hypothetical protein